MSRNSKMYGWENSQAAGQNQQSNPQYQHPWPQFIPNNHVPCSSNSTPLPVVATPEVNMAGQYFSNQGAQVLVSFLLALSCTIL